MDSPTDSSKMSACCSATPRLHAAALHRTTVNEAWMCRCRDQRYSRGRFTEPAPNFKAAASRYSWCTRDRGRAAAMTRRLEVQRPCKTPELLRARPSYQASADDNLEAVVPESMHLESPPSALWTLSQTLKSCTPTACLSSFESLQPPSLAISAASWQQCSTTSQPARSTDACAY
jgi:hypothetical protein